MNEMNTLNLMLGAIMLAEIPTSKKPSVIGRIIIPQDNSYATSVETGCDARFMERSSYAFPSLISRRLSRFTMEVLSISKKWLGLCLLRPDECTK